MNTTNQIIVLFEERRAQFNQDTFNEIIYITVTYIQTFLIIESYFKKRELISNITPKEKSSQNHGWICNHQYIISDYFNDSATEGVQLEINEETRTQEEIEELSYCFIHYIIILIENYGNDKELIKELYYSLEKYYLSLEVN